MEHSGYRKVSARASCWSGSRLTSAAFALPTSAFVAVGSIIGAADAVAQTRVDLDQFSDAPGCIIDPVLETRLGDATGDGMIESETVVLAHNKVSNEFGVAAQASVKVFSAEGEYVRVVGRRGDGPGEFQFIHDIAFSGTNLIVMDQRQRRWTVLSDRGRVLSDSPLRVQPGQFIVVSQDTIVVGSVDLSASAVGYPLHLVQLSDGTILQHFGSQTGEFNVSEPYARRVRVASGGKGASIWVANPRRLHLEEWSLNGELVRIVSGEPDWFPPVTKVPPLGERPPTRLRQFALDGRGRLWVTTWVADRNWEAVARESRDNVEGAISDTRGYFDTRVDLFDLEGRTRCGPHVWESDQVNLMLRADEVLAATVEYDDSLVPRVALYRLEAR